MTRPSLRHAFRSLAALGVVPMACSAPAPAQRGRSADHSAPAEDQTPAVSVVVPTSTGAADPSTTTSEAPTTTAYVITVPTDPPTSTTVRPRPLPVTTLPERVDEDMSDTEWLIRQTFPESPDRAVRIARCESGLEPHATNGQYVGIMQVGSRTHAALIARMGYTVADLYGVRANLAVARAIFDAAGDWSPWTCAA